MKTGSVGWVGFAALLMAAGACVSSTSSGGADGGGDGAGVGGDGSGSGVVTFSCTAGGLCTQIDGPPSSQAGEQSACASQTRSTFAVAPCATANVIACCIHPILVGNEEQCYYAPDYSNPNSLSVVQSLCASQHRMWVAADGGTSVADGGASVGPASFVGMWARSGTQTVTCPTGSPTMTTVGGNLNITLGTTSNTIVGTQPDGCAVTYTVSGDTATAAAGQTCNVTLDGGAHETITVTSHTLTLSADGTTLTSMSSSSIDKLATGTTCTAMASGTFTKM